MRSVLLVIRGLRGDETKSLSLTVSAPGVCFGHRHKLFSLSKREPHGMGHHQRLIDD